MALFVAFLDLKGRPVEINALDTALSQLTAIPSSRLPPTVTAGTSIAFNTGQQVSVRGTVAETRDLLSTPEPPPVLSASQLLLQRTAASALSGHRIVKPVGGMTVDYCDATDLGDVELGLGMTTGAASQGTIVDVLLEGVITEPSWNWTPGQLIFCGPAGSLLSAPGVGSAWSRVVAVAETPTTVLVKFRDPVII